VATSKLFVKIINDMKTINGIITTVLLIEIIVNLEGEINSPTKTEIICNFY
jgi:FlaG/FlaF family flagellin (archaellin)